MLGDQVVVAVVVQDAAAGKMGASGDNQVGRCKTVMTDSRQLALGIQGNPLDRGVEWKARQLLEAAQQLPVVRPRPR